MNNLEERPTKTEFETQRKEHVNLATMAYERAKGIKDQESYEDAARFLVGIKHRRNQWKKFIDPVVKAAKDAHNAALAKRREIEEPLRQAEEDILKPALAKWVTKQEDIRRAQEKEVEKQTGMEVVLPDRRPPDGISYREVWSATVTDKTAFIKAVAEGRIPIEAVNPNQPLLNNMAKNFKTGLGWPGIEVKSERTVAAKPPTEVI